MTAENYMANDDQYHGKCVSLNVSDFSNSSEKSAPKVELKFPDEKLEQANEKIVIKEPLLKCRYLVTLMVFLINFQINCYRLNTSISIVAMVNNTAISTSDAANISSLSCPSNVQEVEMNSRHQVEGEFDWSPQIQGYILGSSFLGYVITQMPGGMMAEKISAKITIITGVLISSLCHLISPFASWSSSNFIIAVQFTRGVGQGFIPAASCVLAANWLPIKERGLLNTVMMSGFCAGALLGGIATGALCSSSLFGGWPSVYYIFGALGIIFSIFLHMFLFESPKTHPRITESELKYILLNQELNLSGKRPPIPWRKLFTSVPFYALTIAMTGQFWASTHFVTVHPTFLGTILRYPIQENGLFASVPFVLQTFLALLVSWISGWLNKHKYAGVDKVRKGCNFLFCVGYSLCLLGIYAAGCDKSTSAPFSILAMGSVGLSFAGCMIAAIDMSPTFAGTIMGVSSIISSLSGFIMPILVGVLTNDEQTLEQWNKVFFISIGVTMTSGIIFSLFGSAEVQDWNFPVLKEFEKGDEKNNKEKMTSGNSSDFKKSTTHL
ncbi:putative inorganic phosphate cotransporter [Argiope bruennichi]|uniref:putative inorganic phosphate cotransporter n=1 Tax=Argiope bruennichi TaxID=94029 RepID=UPI002494E798|nr:putative inorganic phosphate cotransporter [Argiope bruennichi]XP_055942206.1 putative inorganic phosphate cotransporter [Argiope bruennichi]XP_055942207.1 putative inorganic phosphate cotransporter [Argiope bruennichi]